MDTTRPFSDEEDEYFEDLYCDIEEANRKWNFYYSNYHHQHRHESSDTKINSKKVRFADGNNLVKVKLLVVWTFAHRAVRKCRIWQEAYYDSIRFERRIALASTVLSPILDSLHRAKVFESRFSNGSSANL